ncbi:enoyl-CoA hydratase [Lederbergia citrea]|uniref:Enoyl-CoA hydratase n=1 Tax=Lederbergia citrea TaxID=2833581 RepID=A0A942UM72_9BACI|nr:enoyl-CoA hydratase [Lederbergia citrea]MBS4177518.1 enoyl-CoA hydratase [Lederbergia citrea]MBS4204192.1 enoyl-CoA hydratase [Lederbergia citrea]MBS4221223.1 enoyl-CoA hydratase [Lederbergia citrea]
METTFQTVELEIQGSTAVVKMNRPKALNALNLMMIDELDACLKVVRADEKLKMVVLSGNGGAFSAGGDIKEMLQLQGEDAFFNIMDKINALIVTIYSMPQLTIAAIEGAAAGLGLSIALAADHIICSEESRIAMNFIGIGLIPDGGGHFLLGERMGTRKAKQLIWEGKTLTADEAKNIGLVDEVAVVDVQAAVRRRLEFWENRPMLAMIKTKKIYAELNREKLLKTLELEKQGQWVMRQTRDHQEGIEAFVEKRPPVFRGE